MIRAQLWLFYHVVSEAVDLAASGGGLCFCGIFFFIKRSGRAIL